MQLGVEALAQGVVADQGPEVADDGMVEAQVQLGLDARLERGRPQLVQPGPEWHDKRVVREIGEHLTPPERQGVVVGRGGPIGIRPSSSSSPGRQLLEPGRVNPPVSMASR